MVGATLAGVGEISYIQLQQWRLASLLETKYPELRTKVCACSAVFDQYLSIIVKGVRAASHVHLVVAELCCGTSCQLPEERWELAGKTQRQS